MPDEYVGRRFHCPECGAARHVVPSPPAEATAASQHQDAPAAPREPAPRGIGPSLPQWAAVVLVVVFSLLGSCTLLGLFVFFLMLEKATSAVQQAAVAAMVATVLIAGYIIARSVEKVIRAIVRR